MPNNVNARKALRQSKKRRLHNRSITSALRTAVKKARVAATTGGDEAQDAVQAATKKLDQAAAKKLIHKNAAARTKSRLSKLLKKKTAASS